MSRANKSLINDKNLIKQVLSFDGLEVGNVYPSDIDAVIELNNEHLILFEVKRIGNIIPTGQRYMLQRIVDSWQSKSTTGCVVYATHSTKHVDSVILKDCIVEQVYYLGNWIDVKNLTIGEFLKKYYKKHNL